METTTEGRSKCDTSAGLEIRGGRVLLMGRVLLLFRLGLLLLIFGSQFPPSVNYEVTWSPRLWPALPSYGFLRRRF